MWASASVGGMAEGLANKREAGLLEVRNASRALGCGHVLDHGPNAQGPLGPTGCETSPGSGRQLTIPLSQG